ncbi:hypothetical protein DV515_00016204 [Chloebia gouldiae]|uniref:Hydroxysteroid 11-beta-dehydrogenase 1-like protein n=1 Tax=Chloebia gouldiae TaxID=44316 RepID=A0A3L8RUJ6_CHLGU|nr:hypothetical protein DV515_00016204 [Chloebia gouldiae]
MHCRPPRIPFPPPRCACTSSSEPGATAGLCYAPMSAHRELQGVLRTHSGAAGAGEAKGVRRSEQSEDRAGRGPGDGRGQRDMKPIGKVLCATGAVARLLAFFWKDDFNPESLSGARVLMTGASAGTGEQIAYHYARFGAEIVLTDIREAVLQKVVEKCLTLGAKKIFYITADMSSPSEPEKVVEFAVQKLGGLDYLVLNHIGTNRFQECTGDVEYTAGPCSYVALATVALPTLEKNRGALVVVSSLTGKMPTPFTTSYSATKFALDGFFSSLRHELITQKRDVSVTLCILGLTDRVSIGVHQGLFMKEPEQAERCGVSVPSSNPSRVALSDPARCLAGAKRPSAPPPLPRPRSPSAGPEPLARTRFSTRGGCSSSAGSGLFPSSANRVLRAFSNYSSP